MTTIPVLRGTFAMFNDSGADLLKSGLFSDIRVICGQREWKLHRIIMCSRSSYFKKTFEGNFLEAKTGVLELHELEADEVDWVIRYISTALIPTESTTSPKPTIERHVSLIKVADYFDVAGLRDEVCLRLASHFDTLARKINKANRAGTYLDNPSRTFPDSEMLGFFHAVDAAYHNESAYFRALRDPIKEFLSKTLFIVCKYVRFDEMLEAVPRLAVDTCKLLMVSGNKGSGSVVVTELPKECDVCSADVWCLGDKVCFDTRVSDYEEIDGTYFARIQGVCEECKGKK